MPKSVKGYLAGSRADIKEEFKGEVFDKEVKFPKLLGAEHPFDFKSAENVYKKVSIISGAVNKYTDHIVGDFSVKVKNHNSQAIINDFTRTTDFSTVMREWIREAIIKGNGFMELDLKNSKIRVLNANNIYIRRNKKGKLLGYNQFTADMKRFTRDSSALTPFEPNQIAHLPINRIAGDAYGLGKVWPNEHAVEDLVLHLQDHTKIIARKAGAPYHIKVGVPGERVNPAAIEAVKSKLLFMNNKTEWVTDANVDIMAIDFKDLGKNLTESIKQDIFMILAGMEVPEVLLGSGQLNEGIAKVQLEGWQRKTSSMQEQIESILEEQVFRPLLRAHVRSDPNAGNRDKDAVGLDETVEFIWNLPGEEEINNRIMKITELLKLMVLSPEMRAALELELAKVLDLQDLDNILVDPSKAREEQDTRDGENREREREENEIEQPEVPGAKPNANQSLKKESNQKHLTAKTYGEMTIQEFVNLKEIAGFNYSDYLIRILQRIARDPFSFLSAVTEEDVVNGLLPADEIEKLRIVIKNGFKKNKTISEIEIDIRENVHIIDRVVAGKLVSSLENRPNVIARTETVRLANEGLVDLYKENKIEKVRFLAALSDRTCPICEALNGQVFTIKELQGGISQPPIHTNCRCTLISIVE